MPSRSRPASPTVGHGLAVVGSAATVFDLDCNNKVFFRYECDFLDVGLRELAHVKVNTNLLATYQVTGAHFVAIRDDSEVTHPGSQ